MKICPQCSAHYEDSMFFCLEDGQPLKSTDVSVQSNPATFEQTLTLPTDEKTLTLPTQNDLSSEKTLALPPNSVTEQKSVETEAWQPVTTPPQPLPTAETEEKVILTGGADSDENGGKGKFIIVGALLGGIALLGTALGGWWFLRTPSNEIVVANVNKQPENSNNNLGLSNVNLSANFAENNNSNVNSNTSVNVNKSTPKPSPSATKDKKDSPTPTPASTQTPEPTPTVQPTPTPKTPTPTLTPIPTVLPTRKPPPDTVQGGVLNGKAVSLVRPPYPPAAKAVRASGAVQVQVLVNENGDVVRSRAISGHPLLREGAERAARASKFSPTILSGQAVKVTGIIVYNFVP